MCQIDWSALAAWVQAIFSVVAIGVAIWLPKRDRLEQRKQQFEVQKRALISIAKRGKVTLDRLHSRAVKKVVPRSEFGWLRDEAEAISATADRVDLTTLLDSSLADAFVEVQEACRTGARRLKQVINDAKNEDGKITANIPVSADKFDNPLKRVTDAITALEAATHNAY
ncbi:MAG: hypothetical protein JZU55_11075 [Afipia sp.]|nr:hypothetical protein [Afipia sp.]